ncbi:MAG TPA: exodeoxyribonuclease VII large subunit [Burkholderiaceae bacterium]|nr:exodeoxyribonuclease VII large subunit [Burkholderiaceae bacterium]
MNPEFDDAKPESTRVPLTVSALNRAVAGLLSRHLRLVRVRGEIRGMTRAASGHWYFMLKDEQAQVRCVMFRSRNMLVNPAPRDGDEVEVVAQVGLYEPRGEFQLTVESLARSGGGRLFEEFLRLRDRLAAEGLFDASRKRVPPSVPRTIGVVTSLQAAALHDVLAALARRAAYARVVVYPVPVQGSGAGERIADGLATASRRADADVLLLVRGGGSIEDLWAFNEEVVARAIRDCRVPVIVGVGHESDFTIADFAADVRAPTPTAAAELAAPDRAGLLEAVDRRRRALAQWVRHAAQARAQRLDIAQRVLSSAHGPLRGLRTRIQDLDGRAARAVRNALVRGQRELQAAKLALTRARPATARLSQDVVAGRERLRAAVARAVPALSLRVDLLSRALAQLDVDRVLGRGYSIVRDGEGRIVTRAIDVAAGESLSIRFAQGHAAVKVEQSPLAEGPPR